MEYWGFIRILSILILSFRLRRIIYPILQYPITHFSNIPFFQHSNWGEAPNLNNAGRLQVQARPGLRLVNPTPRRGRLDVAMNKITTPRPKCVTKFNILITDINSYAAKNSGG